MIKLILKVLVVLATLAGVATADNPRVVTVQSTRIPPYEKAIEGFASVCKARVDSFVISEMVRTSIPGVVERTPPDLILAVGLDALKQVREVRNLPIVYVMVLHPDTVVKNNNLVTGVRMEIPSMLQLEKIIEVLPKTSNIGLLYDPARTGGFVQDARAAVQKLSLNLFAEAVNASHEVPSALANIEGKVDVFWMLPDITVLTSQTIEFLMLFSLQHQIPVVTFSEKYFDTGAFMSIGLDAVDMGRQAGDIANDILEGKMPETFDIEARSAIVKVNPIIAKKLRIPVIVDSTVDQNGKK